MGGCLGWAGWERLACQSGLAGCTGQLKQATLAGLGGPGCAGLDQTALDWAKLTGAPGLGCFGLGWSAGLAGLANSYYHLLLSDSDRSRLVVRGKDLKKALNTGLCL